MYSPIMGATDNFRRYLIAYLESHPDYTLSQLERDSGVSRTHIRNFMHGKRFDMTLTSSESIASAIGVSLKKMISE